MKRIFTFIAIGFICSLGYGQTEQMIHKSDGSILQLPLSGIDSINFSVSPPASLHIHQTGKSTESVLLTDIDSVTFAGTDWGQPVLIQLAGQVFDENGHPVQGTTVRVGSLTSTSDANGVFYFPAAPVLERLGYVTASKAGFFPGSRTFLPTEGTNKVEIRLLRKNLAGGIQAASGGTVQAEGGSITFSGGSFVQNGIAFNGQVNVALNYIDPESDHFDSEMPGNLLGIMNGNSRHLTSYGMFAAELTDNVGNKVELASTATAQVRFPLSSTLQADAPAEIDLWYFDEETGLWVHEGTAIRQGNEYAAHISHFSFWNCDIPVPYIELNGTITDEEGNAISGAKVTLSRSSSDRGSAYDYTSTAGYFGGIVPLGEVLNLKVSHSCNAMGIYEEVYSQQIGPFSQKTTLSPILVESNFTLVSGAIKGCQNTSITNGYVVLLGNAYFADTSGNFSFISCASGDHTIKAFTSLPWAAGTSKSINLIDPKMDIGALQVCGIAGETVTDIDGNEYRTVIIGTQEWMAENLKTSKFADGSEIPNIINDTIWKDLTTPAWCHHIRGYYDGDPIDENTIDSIFGKLYNWFAVADPHNICPAGWHVPSDVEWTTLTDFLGGPEIAGGKMKSIAGWIDYSGNSGNGTNESGFSGLPGGYRDGHYFGAFGGERTFGGWWSSTETFVTTARNRFLRIQDNNVGRSIERKEYGYFVRCIKD